MRRSSLIAVILSLPVLTSAAHGEPQTITGDELTRMLPGSTVELDTPLGSKVPISYDANGEMSGQAGRVAFFLGSSQDRGRWWISKDRLCQKWNTWLDKKMQCLALKRDGSKVWWTRDDGDTGTATLIARAPEPVREPVPEPAPAAAVQPAPVRTAETKIEPPKSPAAAPLPPKVVAKAAPKIEPKPKPVGVAQGHSTPKPAAAPVLKQKPALAHGEQKLPAARTAGAVPVSLKQPAAAAPAPAQISYRVAHVFTPDVLNVRTGPSADHDIVAVLAPNAGAIRMTGRCELGWCQIQRNATTGWVNSAYLVLEPAVADFCSRTGDGSGPKRPGC